MLTALKKRQKEELRKIGIKKLNYKFDVTDGLSSSSEDDDDDENDSFGFNDNEAKEKKVKKKKRFLTR